MVVIFKTESLMKKTVYAIAALVFALVGCTKEYNETYAPGDVVTLRVHVKDALTKVAANNAGEYSWQAGDKITVLNANKEKFEFTTTTGESDAPFTCTDFEGTLGNVAYYPASGNHGDGSFYLEPEFTWKQDETFMPMIGAVNTGDKSVSFTTAGAAIKLVCYNVPAAARKLVVSSDSKNLSGALKISGEAITTTDGDNAITITFGDSHPTTMVFYIPVPTGKLGKLSFVMQDGSGNNVSNVQETKGEITMTQKHLVAAPALNCSGGEVLWSEDFSDYSADDVPSGTTYVYTCNNGGGTTKIYDAVLAGGATPELLVAKTNGYFQASSVPTNGGNNLQLSFNENYNRIVVSSTTEGVSITGGSFDNVDKKYTCTVKNDNGAATIELRFTNTDGSNVRLDNIVLSAPGSSISGAPTITPASESLTIAVAAQDINTASTTFSYANQLDTNPVVAVVQEGADWLSAAITGSGPYKLTVSAPKNYGSTRSANVTLRATGVTKVITVTQPSASTEASVSIATYASSNGWSNGTKYTSLNVDSNITATVTGGGNTGKYYTSGNDWRFYQNEDPTLSITAADGYTIHSVKITYNISNTGILKNGATEVTSGTEVTVNAKSITFNVGNTGSATNGQVRITAINVVYHE